MQIDRILIGSLLGKTSLGHFTVGSTISSAATYALGGPLMQPLFSGFSRVNDDIGRLRSAYLRGQQLMMMVIMPMGVGLATVSVPVVKLFLGPGWEPVAMVISWFAPAVALQMLTVPVHSLSMAMNQTKLLTVREVTNMLVRLPPTALGAWWYGIAGAVIASAISGLFTIWINLIMARQLIGVSVLKQIGNSWRTLASVLVMTAWEILLIYQLPVTEETPYVILLLIIQLLTGAVVYVATHILFWILRGRPDEAEVYVLNNVKAVYRRLRYK